MLRRPSSVAPLRKTTHGGGDERDDDGDDGRGRYARGDYDLAKEII